MANLKDTVINGALTLAPAGGGASFEDVGAELENINNKIHKWNLIGECTGTAWARKIADISLYNEFMLAITPVVTGNIAQSYRILASTIIPKEFLLQTKGVIGDNVFQTVYMNEHMVHNVVGMCYERDNTFLIRSSGPSWKASLFGR